MTTYKTPYGYIFYDGTGNDHRPNIVDFHPTFPKRHAAAKLQKAALAAFQEAEKRYGRKTIDQKLPEKLRRSRAIALTGSWRSFATQYALWKSDSHRYASPYTSGHVQAVAIDVNTEQPNFSGIIHEVLTNVGWKQSRPSDEPWHYSFGPEV